MPNRLVKCLFAVFVMMAFPAHALPPGAEPPRYMNTKLISPDILPPPVKKGSAEWKKQVAIIVQAQRRLTKQDKAAIEKEQAVSVQLVSDGLGPDFTPEKFPKTFVVLKQIYNDTGIVVETTKQFWGAQRPYDAAPKQVKLLLNAANNNTYPSGHTALSYILAEVLGLLVPDQRPALRLQAEKIALHRIQAGMHYPEDIEAGKKLGGILLGAMLQNDDFQSDMKAAKDELKAAGR